MTNKGPGVEFGPLHHKRLRDMQPRAGDIDEA